MLLPIFACSELGRCSKIEERSKSWLVFMCTAPQAPCAPHIYANANGSIRRLGDIETLGLVLSCSPSLGSVGTLDLGCILGLVSRSGSSWTQWSQQNIAVVGRNILIPGRIFNCFFPSCRLDRQIWSDQTMKLNISQIEAKTSSGIKANRRRCLGRRNIVLDKSAESDRIRPRFIAPLPLTVCLQFCVSKL